MENTPTTTVNDPIAILKLWQMAFIRGDMDLADKIEKQAHTGTVTITQKELDSLD